MAAPGRRAAGFCLVAALCLFAIVPLARAQDDADDAQPAAGSESSADWVAIPDNVLDVLPQAQPLESPEGADDQPVVITVVLHYADTAGFDAYLAEVNGQPAQDRQFLTPSQIADRFGPTEESYEAVIDYLESFGFALVDGSANRLTVTMSGTRSEAEQAFNVSIHDYQLGDQTFFANDTDPQLPAGIAGTVQSVSGLSNLSRPRRPRLTAP